MSHLVLEYRSEVLEGLCGLCGKPIALPAGLQLCLAGRCRPICFSCGRRTAPVLVALQQLAEAAERVGRIHSHSVCPPLGALLELAGAAEKFSSCSCPALL